MLQSCYGVFDKDNTLRQLMYECLKNNSFYLKSRWKEHELLMAKSNQLNFTIDDSQLEQYWQDVLQLAYTPGSSLEQAHIFALCHILRRPIIVYSIKYVKNNRRENISLTYFEGVYLPLLWESSFCFKNPITLGYTNNHFTALVPIEYSNGANGVNTNSNSNTNAGSSSNSSSSNSNTNGGCSSACSSLNISTGDAASGGLNNVAGAVGGDIDQQVFYLPLTNPEGQLLPVHFLNSNEVIVSTFFIF